MYRDSQKLSYFSKVLDNCISFHERVLGTIPPLYKSVSNNSGLIFSSLVLQIKAINIQEKCVNNSAIHVNHRANLHLCIMLAGMAAMCRHIFYRAEPVVSSRGYTITSSTMPAFDGAGLVIAFCPHFQEVFANIFISMFTANLTTKIPSTRIIKKQ